MGPRSGSAQASELILSIARELAETLPGPAEVLVGIMLADRGVDRRVVLDLAVVTESAAFVGIDGQRTDLGNTTPHLGANVLISSLQQGGAIAQPLAVYAFWLGEAGQEGHDGNVPVLPDASAVRQYVLQVTADRPQAPGNVPREVAERLLEQDSGSTRDRSSPLSRLRRGLLNLADLSRAIDAGLQEQIRQPLLLRRHRPILPADVSERLAKAMLARKNILEDADYRRIVPNDYLVELNETNYKHNYAPIEAQVCERWRANLVATLDTTNERWGRQVYKLGGPVRIRIQASPDLAPRSVRVRAAIDPDVEARPAGAAYLESVSDHHRWPVQSNRTTVGRDRNCDVWLDMPAVQEARLVSGCHAHILCREEEYHLFDGDPGSKPSANGTFVNGRRVGPEGRALEDGDVILLASLDPERPRLDTPGVVALAFHTSARERA
jgi:hypothetical protein